MFYNSNISKTVGDNLIRLVLINAQRVALPCIIAIGLTISLLYGSIPTSLLIAWSIMTCSVMLTRLAILHLLVRAKNTSQTFKLDVISIISIANGCSFAALLFFFPSFTGVERGILTTIMAGACVIAFLVDSGYRPFFVNFSLPILTTLAAFWVYNPGQIVEPYIGVIVGLMVVLYGVCLATQGQPTFQDFAVSVESKEKLEVLTRELQTALEQAENAKLQAELSSDSKTRFLAAASHDLRQPVHVLGLYGAVLQAADLSPKLRDIIDDMDIAVESLSSQLDTLLDLSRLDSGAVLPNKQAVNLQLLMQKIANEFVKVAENKQIQFINKVESPVFVWTDLNMISQAIRNLCGNAIKYTHLGNVTVSVTSTDDFNLSVLVSDTGVGISSEHQNHIFEEFYQVANAGRDKKMGLGLGLSIVERIMRSLGHKVELESRPGMGTTFILQLEKCKPEIVCNQKMTHQTNYTNKSLSDSLWIHVVDDDAAVRKSMSLLLEKFGCRVTSTDSSQATFGFLQENSPTALLVDLRLHGDDTGLRIIDYLSSENRTIPTTLVTGESLHVTPLPNRYTGIPTLQKPVSEQALLRSLSRLSGNLEPSRTIAEISMS